MKKHLKVVSVAVLALLSVGILFAAVGDKTYQHLKKSIEVQTGATPECWRVAEIRMTITGDNPCAFIDFSGYKDFNAFIAGKTPQGDKTILIEHIDQMSSYPAVFTELMGRVVQTETFYGAEFVEVVVPATE